MCESVASGPTLESSISFGRYGNDSLSWDKWSSFSPNKYLEEVEKCKTPGSVAQKKAYFEAHYKKIAARKAELLSLEESPEPGTVRLNDELKQDHFESKADTDVESGIPSGGLPEEVGDQESAKVDAPNYADLDEPEEDGIVECRSSLIKEVTEETKSDSACPEPPEAKSSMVEEVTSPEASESIVEQRLTLDSEAEKVPANRNRNPKLNAESKARKVNSLGKERKPAAAKKKPLSPGIKSSQAATPKLSKLPAASKGLSPSESLTKKLSGSSLLKSKKSPVAENKRVTPTSLHMSLSLGPMSSPASLNGRRSLIMETMADKDIVKRAFRAFRNNSNAQEQVPSEVYERKATPSQTSENGNGRVRKATGKTVTQKGSGTRSNSLSSRSDKDAGAERKNERVISSIGLSTNGSTEKSRAGKPFPSTKSKDEKVDVVGKFRQDLNNKPRANRTAYLQQDVKVPLRKGGVKDKIVHQHLSDR